MNDRWIFYQAHQVTQVWTVTTLRYIFGRRLRPPFWMTQMMPDCLEVRLMSCLIKLKKCHFWGLFFETILGDHLGRPSWEAILGGHLESLHWLWSVVAWVILRYFLAINQSHLSPTQISALKIILKLFFKRIYHFYFYLFMRIFDSTKSCICIVLKIEKLFSLVCVQFHQN